MMPCILLDKYWCFGGTCCCCLHGRKSDNVLL